MNAKPTILYGESNAQIMAEQIKTFEKAGYPIATALGRAAIEQALKSNSYALVILGHTLNKDDRHHLPYMVKKANASTRILVLHASCKHPKVDIAIDLIVGVPASPAGHLITPGMAAGASLAEFMFIAPLAAGIGAAAARLAMRGRAVPQAGV